MSMPRGQARGFALLSLALALAWTPFASATPARQAQPVHAASPAQKSTPRTAAVAPAPAAQLPRRDWWREARNMADRGEPDSALALLRPVIAADPKNFDLRWLEAGILGEAGRHAAAVTAYERLVAAFPEHAAEVGSDLAAERLWAGDARGAVRDYRRWLAGHADDRSARAHLALALARSDSLPQALAAYDALLPDDPANTDLALGRARVLSWMGRHDDAIAAYRAVLVREPGNADARLGVAVNENWAGRHRRATHRLESLIATPGVDPEAGKSLAFARYWDDDPDGALRALESYQRQAPGDSEAVQLARRIAREGRSTLTVEFGRADDSDGLHVESPGLELRWPLAHGTTGSAGWRNDHAHDAVASTSVMRLSLGLRRRFSAAWTAYASGSQYTVDGGPDTPIGGEAGVVSRPIDNVRFDIVAARSPVVTRLAIQNGITLLQWVAAADWRVLPRLALHGDARVGSYSDGNRSERTGASMSVKAYSGHRTDLSLQLAVEQLNTHQDLDHGYYDPDFHREWGPGAQLEWRPDARWTLGGATQVGWQRDKGSLAESFYGVSGRIGWAPDDDWTLGLEGGRGDSNLQTAAGYRRTWWQFAVTRAF